MTPNTLAVLATHLQLRHTRVTCNTLALLAIHSLYLQHTRITCNTLRECDSTRQCKMPVSHGLASWFFGGRLAFSKVKTRLKFYIYILIYININICIYLYMYIYIYRGGSDYIYHSHSSYIYVYIQPTAFGVSFLEYQSSIDYLVLYVSFAMFC